jgi:hypothetical protein
MKINRENDLPSISGKISRFRQKIQGGANLQKGNSQKKRKEKKRKKKIN